MALEFSLHRLCDRSGEPTSMIPGQFPPVRQRCVPPWRGLSLNKELQLVESGSSLSFKDHVLGNGLLG